MPPDPPLRATASAEELLNPSVVRQLEVEHTGCFGPCPIYRVQISDDGKYEYEGKKFVARIGRTTGSVYPADVSPLFVWLRDHSKLYATDTDRRSGNDFEEVTFRFGLKSGESVVIESSLGFGGDELWALSNIVDGMIARALIWNKKNGEHEPKPAT